MNDHNKSKKSRVGIVVSDKMDKSIVVKTERLMTHKLYGKIVREHVKYMVDDPLNKCNIGDKVLIEECRPLSKNKRWRLKSVLESGMLSVISSEESI